MGIHEVRVLLDDHEIAERREAAAETDGRAVHGGNDRNRKAATALASR